MPARSSVAAMRHKLLPAFAGHVTICTRSLVGEDLVHHCDSGVPEASMLVRSVELYPYVQSAFEQKTQLVSRLSKTATGAISACEISKGSYDLESGRNKVRDRQGGPSDRMIIPKTLNFTPIKTRTKFRGNPNGINRLAATSVPTRTSQQTQVHIFNRKIEVTTANPELLKAGHGIEHFRIPTFGTLVNVEQPKRVLQTMNFNLQVLTIIGGQGVHLTNCQRFLDGNRQTATRNFVSSSTLFACAPT